MEKREYRMCAVHTGILLLILALCLLAGGFWIPPQYENTFLGELKYKCEALADTGGKRIVIVGGSSVAFGVDSAMVETHFDKYAVINFGMYAGLGTTVMLDLSLDDIRPGDIVILSPEQEAQTLSDYFNAEGMWQAADGDFELLLRVSGENRGALAGAFPYFAADKCRYFVGQNAPDPVGVYSRASFNGAGDMVSAECASNIMPGGYDTNMPIRFAPELLTPEFVARVNTYVKEVQEKGAVVWYWFGPMNALAVEAGADMDAYYDFLDAQLLCDIIGNPHESVLDAEWFYDTNFHLNASGKVINTYRLIRDMKAMLLDSTATVAVLPKKPAACQMTAGSGDNGDASYFTYEMTGDAWTITGLLAEGRGRERLTVPASYQGTAVTAIGAQAFSSGASVQTVVIGENITHISDYAFTECGSLSRIVMKQKNPGNCQVGQALLEGTQARIVVEEAALSDYRANYFWSVYADRIVTK